MGQAFSSAVCAIYGISVCIYDIQNIQSMYDIQNIQSMYDIQRVLGNLYESAARNSAGKSVEIGYSSSPAIQPLPLGRKEKTLQAKVK